MISQNVLDKSKMISFIVSILNDLNVKTDSSISTPSGEPFDQYIEKCIKIVSSSADGELVPAEYHHKIFYKWAEKLIKNRLIPTYRAYELGMTLSEITRNEDINFDPFTSHFLKHWTKNTSQMKQNLDTTIKVYLNEKQNHRISFSPNGDTIDNYLNNVISNNNKGSNNDAQYSLFVFTLWIQNQYTLNGYQNGGEIRSLSNRYFFLKDKQNIDILEDANRAINLFKNKNIIKNSFPQHFLLGAIHLVLSAILEKEIGLNSIEGSYGWIGHILLENADLENAEYFLKRSVQVNSEYNSGYNGLADVYRHMRKYSESILQSKKELFITDKYKDSKDKPIYFKTVEDYNSLYADCYYNIAVCSAYIYDYKTAFYYIDKAIGLNSDYFGQKLDHFNDLKDVKDYITNLYNDFKKDIIIDSSNISMSNPAVREIITTLFKDNSLIKECSYYTFLTEKSQIVLENTFAMEIIKDGFNQKDYSHFTNHYIKVLEIELFYKIIKKLESWIIQNDIKDIDLRYDIYGDKEFKRAPLGSYRFILSERKIKECLQANFENNYIFVCSEIPDMIEKLREIRNGGAHLNLTDHEKYIKIKNILFEQGFLEKISKL